MAIAGSTEKGRRARARYLAASAEVFARDGYVNATMSSIASAAGYSQGAIYRYFPSKDAVFSDLMAHTHEELLVSTRTGGLTDPWDALDAANRGFLTYWSERAGILRAFEQAQAVDSVYGRGASRTRSAMRKRFVYSFEKRFGALSEADREELDALVLMLIVMTERMAVLAFASNDTQEASISLERLCDLTSKCWRQILQPFLA